LRSKSFIKREKIKVRKRDKEKPMKNLLQKTEDGLTGELKINSSISLFSPENEIVPNAKGINIKIKNVIRFT